MGEKGALTLKLGISTENGPTDWIAGAMDSHDSGEYRGVVQ